MPFRTWVSSWRSDGPGCTSSEVQPPDRLACGGIPELDHACTGYLGHPFKNMDFETENDLPPLLANTGRSVYNQTSSYSILMLERRYSHMMEKLLLWVVFLPLSSA
jgi:hypothetical protein